MSDVIPTILERNRHRVTVVWRDPDGNAVNPTTVRWKLDCLTTGTEIATWQTVTSPTSTTVIEISALYNTIQNSSNQAEIKEVTVQANQGLATQINTKGQYIVENAKGYT